MSEKRIALFGAGVTNVTKGGTGSGEVNNRDNVTIYQGFVSRGFTIASTKWIEDYKQAKKEARKEFKARLKEALKGKPRSDEDACYWSVDPIMESFPVGRTPWQRLQFRHTSGFDQAE